MFSTAGRAKGPQHLWRKEKKAARPPGTEIPDRGARGVTCYRAKSCCHKPKKIKKRKIIGWILGSVRDGGKKPLWPAEG